MGIEENKVVVRRFGDALTTGRLTDHDLIDELLLAATLFAHDAAAFRVHGSAGLDEHGGPLAASVSTISPG